MVTALFGENDYEVKQRKAQLIAAYLKKVGSDMGLEQFDSTVNPLVLWQSITAQPFLVDSKLVILNQPSETAELRDFLTEKFKEVPDTTHLVLIEGKVDKRTGYYKQLKKYGEEMKPLDERQVIEWVNMTVKDRGGKLGFKQTQELVHRVGTNQWRLHHELEKLLPLGEVTLEQIKELVDLSARDTIFNLLDELTRGNTRKAVSYYDSLRAQQLDPIYIMSMLTWQMENILLVATAGQRSDNEIARDAGINPYVVQKTRSVSHSLGRNSLENALELLVNTDEKLKNTSINADEALKLLLINLSRVFA